MSAVYKTLTYARWRSMLQRCRNPKVCNYKHYGARGIKVCERWLDFASFLADMGECPDKSLTLDRIDSGGNYEPGNCRWATMAEQNCNRSNCIRLTRNGVTKNATDWAKEIGIRPGTLLMRLRLGWTPERALSKPVKSWGDRK